MASRPEIQDRWANEARELLGEHPFPADYQTIERLSYGDTSGCRTTGRHTPRSAWTCRATSAGSDSADRSTKTTSCDGTSASSAAAATASRVFPDPPGPVTVADVNLKFIWDVVSRIKIGEKGKAYVVDSNGFLVAHPDIGLVLRKTDLSQLAHVKAANAPTQSDAPATIARDLAGTEVLASWAPIEPLGWKVFAEQPGTVHAVKVGPGDVVQEGDVLLELTD